MIPANAIGPDAFKEAKLPRRDWILLPMLGLMTIALMLALVALIRHRMFSETQESWKDCMVLNDPSTGVRGIPNSVCRIKSFESTLVEYRMNSCGHRAGMECVPKQPNTYRIVMTGSSFAEGARVRREDSFAALLPQELSAKTSKKIELYNEGMGWGFTHSVALRFKEVLGAEPDMILWILTPTDIERASPTSVEHGVTTSRSRMKQKLARSPILMTAFDHSLEMWNTLNDMLHEDEDLLRHFLYKSQSLYVNSSLEKNYESEDAGFLKAKLSKTWQSDLQQTEMDAECIEGQAKASGIPFVAVLLPNRAQAAIISMGEWPASYDPYKLDNELRRIIESHGGIYLDVLPDFRTIPNPEQYYLPVDGHPNADGHAIIADLLAKALTDGSVPALRAVSPTQPDREKCN